MNETIRIRLSIGLVIVAIIHAIALAAVFTGLHRLQPPATHGDAWTVPVPVPDPSCHRPIGELRQLPQPAVVDLHAQGEMKQQAARPFTGDTTWELPSSTHYQIALFVTADSKSQQLLKWFQNDPKLLDIRKKCSFQIYTPQSPIYRTRFAKVVPAEQFPVMLFLAADGGHIHAAGKNMIPGTATELHSDMKAGFKMYQQSHQAARSYGQPGNQTSGLIKSEGYSWDAAIAPTMRLQSQDCDGGICPIPQPDTTWRPGDRVRDNLFDGASDAKNAFLWANATELMTIGVVVVLVMLIGALLLKRGF